MIPQTKNSGQPMPWAQSVGHEAYHRHRVLNWYLNEWNSFPIELYGALVKFHRVLIPVDQSQLTVNSMTIRGSRLSHSYTHIYACVHTCMHACIHTYIFILGRLGFVMGACEIQGGGYEHGALNIFGSLFLRMALTSLQHEGI